MPSDDGTNGDILKLVLADCLSQVTGRASRCDGVGIAL